MGNPQCTHYVLIVVMCMQPGHLLIKISLCPFYHGHLRYIQMYTQGGVYNILLVHGGTDKIITLIV